MGMNRQSLRDGLNIEQGFVKTISRIYRWNEARRLNDCCDFGVRRWMKERNQKIGQMRVYWNQLRS
jgi:hypothetical protein